MNMGKGVPGCVGILGPLLILLAIFEAISPAVKSLVQMLAVLFTLAVIGGVTWVVTDFMLGNQKQETVVIRGIDPNLLEVLAQVEGQEPIRVLPALRDMSVEQQESVIRDTNWGSLELQFVRDTEDGKIRTTVCSEQGRARVRMFHNNDTEPFVNLDYVSVMYWRIPPPQKQSPENVHHVREWIRRQLLPELEVAKTRREAEYRQLAAKREAELAEERRKREEEEQKREKLRQKYLS